ncbi:SpoIIE family protein phosphatase [Allostreptomyces psammosilenae]|uniref:PAS domain S-box-containing protein n=1 Tax=Allostreptomyces psammosilenae TaxID=1892865 RepID=A0A853A0G2_9ACTN|nr:SpoIIE family protein phosphatase [Allostreptomyces psammosilenae]NYI08066.1 PAS domain S-box-containing protein [Allostreptomyces psammosilenae]
MDEPTSPDPDRPATAPVPATAPDSTETAPAHAGADPTPGPAPAPDPAAESRREGGQGWALETHPESQSSLFSFVNFAVVVCDPRGRVVLWSRAAEDLLGWPAPLMIGRRITELIPVTIGPEQGGELQDLILRTGHWSGTFPMLHRDGRVVLIESRVSLLEDGDGSPLLLAAFAEAAALRRVEHDLALRDGLIESSPVAIGFYDTDLRFISLNRAMADLTGAPVEDHIGRTLSEVVGDTPQSRRLQALQAQVVRTGEPVVDHITEGAAAHRGGEYRSVSYHRIDDQHGRPIGVSALILDVTERQRAIQRVEAARRRLALLNQIGARISDLLDGRRIAQELASALVPALADHTEVLLYPSVPAGGDLPERPDPGVRLIQYGAASVIRVTPEERRDLAVWQMLEDDGPFSRTMLGARPEVLHGVDNVVRDFGDFSARADYAHRHEVDSMAVLPLRVRGSVLGVLLVGRSRGRRHLDEDDVAFAMEVADRAATALDNARLYARERDTALTLQRSLLPQAVPQPMGMEIAYRYVPAAVGAEAGGDWFDVIELPGGRVALVVGDVTGHGLRAAATMGRLRTAVRTLAGLDLPPDEVLRHVHGLVDDLALSPDEALLATCLYAVYDPATRRCTMARAGHMPPIIVEGQPTQRSVADWEDAWPGGFGPATPGSAARSESDLGPRPGTTDRAGPTDRAGTAGGPGPAAAGGEAAGVAGVAGGAGAAGGATPCGPAPEGTSHPTTREVTTPAGVPLGVGGVRFVSEEIELADGSWLVLYTDGLVETRGEDLVTGVRRLRDCLERPYESIEQACETVLTSLRPGHQPNDDTALLIARVGGLPEHAMASWTLVVEPRVVGRARRLVRDTLVEWRLTVLLETAELLVSELVTNALRYAGSPILLRMRRGRTLLVEVGDPLPDPPRERATSERDEGGRGIQLVAALSRAWGTRFSGAGKVVWFELDMPRR